MTKKGAHGRVKQSRTSASAPRLQIVQPAKQNMGAHGHPNVFMIHATGDTAATTGFYTLPCAARNLRLADANFVPGGLAAPSLHDNPTDLPVVVVAAAEEEHSYDSYLPTMPTLDMPSIPSMDGMPSISMDGLTLPSLFDDGSVEESAAVAASVLSWALMVLSRLVHVQDLTSCPWANSWLQPRTSLGFRRQMLPFVPEGRF